LRALLVIILFVVAWTTLPPKALAQFKVTASDSPFMPFLGLKTNFNQVRIDQGVIVRFPASASVPVTAGAQRQSVGPIKYKEKKIGKCLWVNRLGGSRPGPDRSLDLVTRDGILIRAYLGEGCLAREFYAGTYMERSYDGKLCVNRDLLHARTGAKCDIDKFRLLIPR
jgi:hypothetical protein